MSLDIEDKEPNKFGLSDEDVAIIHEFGGAASVALSTKLDASDTELLVLEFLKIAKICNEDLIKFITLSHKCNIGYYSSVIMNEIMNIPFCMRWCRSRVTYDCIKKRYPKMITTEMRINHDDIDLSIDKFNYDSTFNRMSLYKTDTDLSVKLKLMETHKFLSTVDFNMEVFDDCKELPEPMQIIIARNYTRIDSWDVAKYPILKPLVPMVVNKNGHYKYYFMELVIKNDYAATLECALEALQITPKQFAEGHYNFADLGPNIAAFLGVDLSSFIFERNHLYDAKIRSSMHILQLIGTKTEEGKYRGFRRYNLITDEWEVIHLNTYEVRLKFYKSDNWIPELLQYLPSDYQQLISDDAKHKQKYREVLCENWFYPGFLQTLITYHPHKLYQLVRYITLDSNWKPIKALYNRQLRTTDIEKMHQMLMYMLVVNDGLPIETLSNIRNNGIKIHEWIKLSTHEKIETLQRFYRRLEMHD